MAMSSARGRQAAPRGAVNLVHYTRLRRHDLRELQNDLLDIGPRPWRPPSAPAAKVRAARNVLAALRGDAGPWDLQAIDDALDEGDEILDANSHAIFGRCAREADRIMVTLPGEAADDPELVASFVDAGMDVARSTAPTTTRQPGRGCASVRAAADRAGRQVLVSMDCRVPSCGPGPLSTGHPWAVPASRAARAAGPGPARIWLTHLDARPAPGRTPRHSATLSVQVDQDWLVSRGPGDVVTLQAPWGQAHVHGHPGWSDGVLAEGDRNATSPAA